MEDNLISLVTPYYLMLLGGNFVGGRDKEFNQSLKAVIATVDNSQLEILPAEKNWRPKITGAYFCGLLAKDEFLSKIGSQDELKVPEARFPLFKLDQPGPPPKNVQIKHKKYLLYYYSWVVVFLIVYGFVKLVRVY